MVVSAVVDDVVFVFGRRRRRAAAGRVGSALSEAVVDVFTVGEIEAGKFLGAAD